MNRRVLYSTTLQTNGQEEEVKLKEELEAEIAVLKKKCERARALSESKNKENDHILLNFPKSYSHSVVKKAVDGCKTTTLGQNRQKFSGTSYIEVSMKPKEVVKVEKSAYEAAVSEHEKWESKQAELLCLQEQRKMDSKARFQAALEKKRLEEEYSTILKLLDEAQKAQMKQQAKAVSYTPQGTKTMCAPVDKIIKRDFQNALEREVKKIFKSTKEHAIEDLEGYTDELEKRYVPVPPKPCPSYEDIAYDSLLRKDNFEERYFLAREKESDEDLLNTAYVDSPPSVERTGKESSETQTYSVVVARVISEKPRELEKKKNAAVQSEAVETQESKGVQASFTPTERDLKKLKTKEPMFSSSELHEVIHSPRKCFDVVRNHLFRKDQEFSSTDTSGSTVYHPLPPTHGSIMFPSLYQPHVPVNQEENSHTSVPSKNSNTVSSLLDKVSSSRDETIPKQLLQKNYSDMRLLPSITDDVVSTSNAPPYLEPITSEYDIGNDINTGSSKMICAIPLSEPIREKPSESPKQCDENSMSPEIFLSSEAQDLDRDDALGVNLLPRHNRVPSLSLLANLSEGEDSSADLGECGTNITETSFPNIFEDQVDTDNLKSVRESVFQQLKVRHPTLEAGGLNFQSNEDTQEEEKEEPPLVQIKSNDIPFVYHELSTIQEVDSSLNVLEDSKASFKGARKSDHSRAESNILLNSLLDNQIDNTSRLLENIRIIPQKSPEKVIVKNTCFPRISSPTIDENKKNGNLLIEGAKDLSNCSLSAVVFYPLSPYDASSSLTNKDNSIIKHISSSSESSSKSMNRQEHLKELDNNSGPKTLTCAKKDMPQLRGPKVLRTSLDSLDLQTSKLLEPLAAKSGCNVPKIKSELNENLQDIESNTCSTRSSSSLEPFAISNSKSSSSDYTIKCNKPTVSDLQGNSSKPLTAEARSSSCTNLEQKQSLKDSVKNSNFSSMTGSFQPLKPVYKVHRPGDIISFSDVSTESSTFDPNPVTQDVSPLSAVRSLVEKQRVAYYDDEKENPPAESLKTKEECFKKPLALTVKNTKPISEKPMSSLPANLLKKIALSTSSDDSLSNMFSGSKIAYHSTPVRSEFGLSSEEGILEQPEITLIGSDELTLHRTAMPEQYMVQDASTKHSGFPAPQSIKQKSLEYQQRKMAEEHAVSDKSKNHPNFSVPQTFKARSLEFQNTANKQWQKLFHDDHSTMFPLAPQSEGKLSTSMVSFLRHEMSSEAAAEDEHVSLVSSQPESLTSCFSNSDNSRTPRSIETSSGSSSSKVDKPKGGAEGSTNTPSSESYKKRTKRLWNNLAEVKAKQQIEEKKKKFMLNKQKVKELQEKLQSNRKGRGGKSKRQ